MQESVTVCLTDGELYGLYCTTVRRFEPQNPEWSGPMARFDRPTRAVNHPESPHLVKALAVILLLTTTVWYSTARKG